MEEPKRDRVLNVRLSEREVSMLGELADFEGQSVSDWVRTIIRIEHARSFRPKQTRRARRRPASP